MWNLLAETIILCYIRKHPSVLGERYWNFKGETEWCLGFTLKYYSKKIKIKIDKANEEEACSWIWVMAVRVYSFVYLKVLLIFKKLKSH